MQLLNHKGWVLPHNGRRGLVQVILPAALGLGMNPRQPPLCFLPAIRLVFLPRQLALKPFYFWAETLKKLWVSIPFSGGKRSQAGNPQIDTHGLALARWYRIMALLYQYAGEVSPRLLLDGYLFDTALALPVVVEFHPPNLRQPEPAAFDTDAVIVSLGKAERVPGMLAGPLGKAGTPKKMLK